MSRNKTASATAIGLIAIVLWSGLALFTVQSKGIPPFELLALSFGVAFITGTIAIAGQGRHAFARLRQPVAAWLLAFCAIFFYHALYFFALSTVPPARASLIAYLWPLLIVVISAFSRDGISLRWQHFAGAAIGFAGAVALFMDHHQQNIQASNVLGYGAAFGCATIWSVYSVVNRRFAHIPSDMLVGVFGAVALGGAAAHMLFENSVWPGPSQWLAVLLLGIGPTGLAFLAWDHATKHGNIPLLGSLSYLAPLISTLLLIINAQAQSSFSLGVSAALIVVGALLASYRRKSKCNT